MIRPSMFLRRAILADAIFSGASALLLTFGAGALAPLLNLPEALLRETGLFLIAYAALVGWLGTRQSMPRALVAIVIAGNAAWSIASIALLFSGWVTPNIPGEVFVAAQAIAVGVFAELQYVGLRRSEVALTAQA
jgi:CHASE2 domain-containing sensor protein